MAEADDTLTGELEVRVGEVLQDDCGGTLRGGKSLS